MPGEPSGERPWPTYLDDEYRRITAADGLSRDFSDNPLSIVALSAYAESGDVPEVRCRCLALLGALGSVDSLVDKLIDDPEPDIRCYALEYLLVNHPDRFHEIETCFAADLDSEINEILSCFRRGDPIPLYYYDMPLRDQ
ncbi:hypothetical protein UC8_42860 [Roseimaritima ulvae]|uniref:HEAT repeat protein n=1 Tax=Roseimaritima ulvae TaxID=980254 RepID=A0A5B9QW91_9BACT|nr:hypothetical protein UC8_42860 [Roseimaritima ulvae]